MQYLTSAVSPDFPVEERSSNNTIRAGVVLLSAAMPALQVKKAKLNSAFNEKW